MRYEQKDCSVKVLLDEVNGSAYLFNKSFSNDIEDKFYIDEEILFTFEDNNVKKTVVFEVGEYNFTEYDRKPAVSVPFRIE